ncbi:hypothetical protein [Sphingomonas sp.]|jgi:ElaB/YqjD/DUF883 family membrane-anchored ribosome-binding protein|uniref:hypothetical protein n=1 Tax=Sphingomonas sp. TaxID=28214 RepID=UPI002E34649D|nr:hypothetical protein [Sphingomonas sp.]HEX4693374.1 hypothetical protein [Sphingomonas sp.]
MTDTAPNETTGDTAGNGAAVGGEATPGVQTLKDNVIKFANDAGEKAKAAAEDGKNRAGGALDELAVMLKDAAGTVDQKVGEQYGQYARSAADAVSNFSQSLQAKQIDDLIDDAREFVKKSPAVAIGTAAAIGFVLARLVKAGLDAPADNDKV